MELAKGDHGFGEVGEEDLGFGIGMGLLPEDGGVIAEDELGFGGGFDAVAMGTRPSSPTLITVRSLQTKAEVAGGAAGVELLGGKAASTCRISGGAKR